MRKVRNGAILVMTVVIIGLCAMLPRITAQVQDSVSDEKVEYEDIKTVTFQTQLNIVEKLFLLRDGLRVSVPEENVSSTSEEVLDYVYEALDRYTATGMVYEYTGTLGGYNIKYEPMLFFFNDSENTSAAFWLVEMTRKYEGEVMDSISMWIDDQTGQLLLIDFEAVEQVYFEDATFDILSTFYSTYIDSLQLFEDEDLQVFQDMDPYPEESQETNSAQTDSFVFYAKKGSSKAVFRVGDMIYGELNLYFCVHSNGFFISLS